MSKVKGGGKILDVDGKGLGGRGGGWSLNLENLHGRHMCIVSIIWNEIMKNIKYILVE